MTGAIGGMGGMGGMGSMAGSYRSTNTATGGGNANADVAGAANVQASTQGANNSTGAEGESSKVNASEKSNTNTDNHNSNNTVNNNDKETTKTGEIADKFNLSQNDPNHPDNKAKSGEVMSTSQLIAGSLSDMEVLALMNDDDSPKDTTSKIAMFAAIAAYETAQQRAIEDLTGFDYEGDGASRSVQQGSGGENIESGLSKAVGGLISMIA